MNCEAAKQIINLIILCLKNNDLTDEIKIKRIKDIIEDFGYGKLLR